MTDYIYDEETYPNFYSIVIGNASTRKMKSFEISTRNDQRFELIEYLREIKREGGRMVGFNNVGFDYPVLHYILTNQDCTVAGIYRKAMRVIEAENKFEHIIRDKDELIPQIDLFKIHHFDNMARATSLKMLEFNMRSDTIEDLPFEPGTVLTSDQMDVVLQYNKKDMIETFKFYNESSSSIEFREQLTEQLGKNFMNHNDTKIGKDFFVMELEKNDPGCCYKRGKVQQTKRSSIDLSECIFDYVKFERPEFQAVLDWFKAQNIVETKGVFTDILESDLGDVAKYANLRKKRQKQMVKPSESKIAELKKKHPMGWLSEEQLKSGKISYWWNWNVADTLNVVIDGFQYDFGVGGIHGSIESDILETKDGMTVRDEDVASYYPNLAIKNRIHPKHLGDSFCDIYEELYQKRVTIKKQMKAAKASGDMDTYRRLDDEQAMLKLALNGTYGASNDKYSPFYDPMFTMKITINGQLSLCMLAEELLKIDGLSMIQVNTDGLTFLHPDESKDKVTAVTDWWQEVTKLELEGVDYNRMFIRDVNNYISETMDGKLKNKGAYAWKNINHDPKSYDVGWHQNQSSPIIAMAAEAHLIRGENISEFIKAHEDPFDFMLRTKVPRSSKLMLNLGGEEVRLQNITRYYISVEGGELIKVMPPLDKVKMGKLYRNDDGEELVLKTKTEYTRYEKKGYKFIEDVELPKEERRIGINTGQKVTVCNDMVNVTDNINYQYYINEAEKLCELSVDTQ